MNMDNKIKALIIINNKVNERIKTILYKEPQEEKMMFEGIRDVLQMTSELTERIERISDDFINKETLLNCLSSELQSYIYDLSETDLDRMIYITLYAEKLKLSIDKLELEGD
jgi:hypothetical protein